MYLKLIEENNGYGCSCCSSQYDTHEWTETIPSFKEVYFDALVATLDGAISIRYEKDGILLYGFESNIYRKGMDTYFIFGGNANDNPFQRTCIRSDDGSKETLSLLDLKAQYDEFKLIREAE